MIIKSREKIEHELANRMIANVAGKVEACGLDYLSDKSSNEEKAEYYNKILPFIKKGISLQSKVKRSQGFLRSTRVASVILLVSIAITAVTLSQVEAFRINVLNFFKIEEYTHTLIDSSEEIYYPLGWNGYILNRVPHGFYLESHRNTTEQKMLFYKHNQKTESYIFLEEYEKSFSLKINTENRNVENIDHMKYEGFVVWDESNCIIYLFVDNANIVITSNLPKDTVVDLLGYISYV